MCYFQVYSKVTQLHINFFQIIFLILQNIEYSSLSYTVNQKSHFNS